MTLHILLRRVSRLKWVSMTPNWGWYDSKHLPLSEATEKGHMIQIRQGINSTSYNKQAVRDARQDIKNMFPTEHVWSAIENEIFWCAVIGYSHKNTIYSDLTGRFPIQSYKGMNYIFVAYVYKLNAILLRFMKSREDASMLEAFTSVYTELETVGHKPKLHVLDNECSRAVQKLLIKKVTARKNVESHNHRVNTAEPVVKTAKYHIIHTLPRSTTSVQYNCGLRSYHRCRTHSTCSAPNRTITNSPLMKNSMVGSTGIEPP